MRKIFRCPYCKSDDGYWGEIAVKGYNRTLYSNRCINEGTQRRLFELGKETYTCVECRRDITPEVNKFIEELNKKD